MLSSFLFSFFLYFSQSLSYFHSLRINHSLFSIAKQPSFPPSKTKLYVAPPSTYSKVEKDCLNSLSKFLQTNPSSKRLSVDILTPGLNPKLEQKAILLQEYLFALVYEISLVLSVQFNSVQLLFPSIGDAASYQKYTRLQFLDPPTNIVLADVSLERISAEDDAALFITTKNNIGDPVIRTVQSICETYPQLTAIFLNCDLSDRVTSGMQEKRIRDAFRSSIRVCYYFRNLVQISRPSMTPYELGCLRYAPGQGWEIYALNEGDVTAMGSLNRYMKQGSFRRNDNVVSMSSLPTTSGSTSSSSSKNNKIYRNAESGSDTLAPPRFILAKRYDKNILTMPSRDEIDAVVTNTLARAERERQLKSKATGASKKNNVDDTDKEQVEEDAVSKAQRIIYNLATTGSTAVDANTLLSACRTVCTVATCSTGTSTTLIDTVNSNSDILKSETATMNMNEVAGLGYSTTSTATVVIPASTSTKTTNDILPIQSSSSIQLPYEGVWEAMIEMNCRHVENMSIYMRPSSSSVTSTTGGSDMSGSSDIGDDGLMECGLSGESVECYDVDTAVFQLNYLTKNKLMIQLTASDNASDNINLKNIKTASSSYISSTKTSTGITGTLQRKQEMNMMGLMKLTTSSQSYNYYDIINTSQQQQVKKQQQRTDDWLAGKLILNKTDNTSSSGKDSKSQSLLNFIWVLPFSTPPSSSSSTTATATETSSRVITIALTHESNEPISYSLPTSSTPTTTAAVEEDTVATTKNILFPLLQENKIITQQLQQQPEQIIHKYILWKRIVE